MRNEIRVQLPGNTHSLTYYILVEIDGMAGKVTKIDSNARPDHLILCGKEKYKDKYLKFMFNATVYPEEVVKLVKELKSILDGIDQVYKDFIYP